MSNGACRQPLIAMMENPIKIMRLGTKQSVDKPIVAA
jgi:hypothetical protein